MLYVNFSKVESATDLHLWPYLLERLASLAYRDISFQRYNIIVIVEDLEFVVIKVVYLGSAPLSVFNSFHIPLTPFHRSPARSSTIGLNSTKRTK